MNFNSIGTINRQLEIAMLSEFSKACGISNSPQLEKLKSERLQGYNSVWFGANEQVDSNTFKNDSRSEFRTKISNLIYDSYFQLLSTDSAFAKSQSDAIELFSKNLISADAYRLIILDSVSDELDSIIAELERAVISGKTITAEELQKKIKQALQNNKEKINDETKKFKEKTAQDGTPNYTPYSALAISQRYKGIRWRPIKGSSLSPKALDRIRKQTNNIKTNLQKVKSGLRTAKSIVSLLKVLESTFSNGIIGILKTLSKIVFSYVRDIGSSGVYMLNMCEPYYGGLVFDKGSFIQEIGDPKNLDATVDEYHARLLKEKIDRNHVINANDYMGSDMTNSMFILGDMSAEERDEVAGIKEDDELWKLMEDNISGFYKPTTYMEFVNTIAEAFEDEGDLPSAAPDTIDMDFFGNKLKLKYQYAARTSVVNRKNSGGQGENALQRAFRPGRPKFGSGSNVNVIIVAFSIPNILQFTLLATGALRNFVNIMNFFGVSLLNIAGTNDPAAKAAASWYADNVDIFQKRWNRLWNKTTSTSLFDYFSDPPKFDDKGDIVIPVSSSKNPDFYGKSIRSIFPDFFEYLDIVEERIDKYTKNFKSALSKELDNLLKNIEELINDLEDFIELIDSIVSFFETLQTMGLYTLQITSNGGNADIIEKIRVAENFPGVKEGDQLRLIGGLLFCYGTPNPKPGNIDFSGLIKQKMAMMNYEASKAKFETSGLEEDDPGSFQDYIAAENFIGTNYNSSLDKIFKKLF